MGSISDKLQYLSETKEAIKDILTEHSIDVSTGDSFRSYADKIEDLRACYAFEPLPFTTIPINGINVNYTPYIKIFASDLKSYTAIEWGELVHNNPNLKDTLQPLGYDIKGYGQHFVIINPVNYIPDYIGVPGTNEANNTTKGGANADKLNRDQSVNNGATQYLGIRVGLYSIDIIKNETDTNVINRLSNPDGTTASIIRDGNNLTLSTQNAPFTWTIRENCGFKMTPYFSHEPQKDILRMETVYTQTEWLRHRASIVAKDSNDNDIATELPDGEYADRVDIVTENGEMYFKIIVDENDSSKDILTNNLAKYNIHNFGYDNAINLTSTIAEQIYKDQKANGVNMNSGLDPNDTLRVLTPGAKGAEAYVFQGKWRIITPILTLCYTSYNKDRNMPDAPAIYYWKNVIYPKYEAMGIHNIQFINETWGIAYALNRLPIIVSLNNFLRNSAGGGYGKIVVPETYGGTSICPSRLHRTSIVAISCPHIYTYGGGPQTRYMSAFGFNLDEPVTPPTIELNASNKMVITADSNMTIYYSKNNQTYEPAIGHIGYQNSVIRYTSPVTVANGDEIRAIAVNSERRCSLPTYMKIQFPAPAEPTIYQDFTYAGSIYFRISAESGATIYYTKTLDEYGIVPNPNDLGDISTGHTKKYTTNENIYMNTNYYYNTIKAIAVKNGMTSSVATMTYYYDIENDDWE